VVESFKDGDAHELGRAVDLRRALGGDGGLATQPLMGSGNVVVLLDELPQQSLQVSLA
jgi:hypothetical protein